MHVNICCSDKAMLDVIFHVIEGNEQPLLGKEQLQNLEFYILVNLKNSNMKLCNRLHIRRTIRKLNTLSVLKDWKN